MCPIPPPMPPPKPPPEEREHKLDYTNYTLQQPPFPLHIKSNNQVLSRDDRMQVCLRMTYPFQKNLQILDSWAYRCDQSRGPFHQFQTCTCLKAGGKVTSHPPEGPEQNLTSDLT